MKRQTEQLIKEMVRRIVERFNPEKVILFGSYARGTAGPDSDVDLLVVMRVRGAKRKTQLRIRTALHDILLPKDVIVSDTAEFDWRKEGVGTIGRSGCPQNQEKHLCTAPERSTALWKKEDATEAEIEGRKPRHLKLSDLKHL